MSGQGEILRSFCQPVPLFLSGLKRLATRILLLAHMMPDMFAKHRDPDVMIFIKATMSTFAPFIFEKTYQHRGKILKQEIVPERRKKFSEFKPMSIHGKSCLHQRKSRFVRSPGSRGWQNEAGAGKFQNHDKMH